MGFENLSQNEHVRKSATGGNLLGKMLVVFGSCASLILAVFICMFHLGAFGLFDLYYVILRLIKPISSDMLNLMLWCETACLGILGYAACISRSIVWSSCAWRIGTIQTAIVASVVLCVLIAGVTLPGPPT